MNARCFKIEKTGWQPAMLFSCFVFASLCFRASAQQYSIDWYKIAGGGGTSSGGQYVVSGTIGQPDANGAMVGGNYSLTGGFWALVQTPGAPLMTITTAGNQVIISWPAAATGWTLQTNGNFNSGGWANYGGTVTSNSVTVTPSAGNRFFRLVYPNP